MDSPVEVMVWEPEEGAGRVCEGLREVEVEVEVDRICRCGWEEGVLLPPVEGAGGDIVGRVVVGGGSGELCV